MTTPAAGRTGQVESPRWAAGAAARAAGVRVVELGDAAGAAAATAVFEAIWGSAGSLPAGAVRALAHAGNYVAGAYDGDELVGAVVAFLGAHAGTVHLHSHITGVLPGAQGRSVGLALKLHQRAWALERGIGQVRWTYDPLVRRNAYFNLTKLGATAVAYHPDFYGDMDDAINAGDPTDRCVAVWDLASPRAVAAAAGTTREPDRAALAAAGARVLLAEDEAGVPAVRPGAPAVRPADAGVLLCQVPGDVVRLRATRPELARGGRRAVRATRGQALAGGYAATAASRSGWCVLERAAGGP